MNPKKGLVQGEIMDPDDNAQYDSPELIAKTDERLAALTGNPIPVVKKPVETEEVDDTSDLTPEDDDAGTVDDDTANGTEDTDDDATEGDDTTEGEDKGVVIPEQLYRAAIHNEWKPEDVTKFWKNNPELAKKTLEKMHTDMVNTNNVYVEHGRAAKQIQEQRNLIEGQRTVPTTPAKQKDFVDIEAAREEFGDGAAAIIKQLNDALVKVTTTQRPNQEVSSGSAQQETDLARREKSMAALQQMSYWFADDSMKGYEEFYGSGRDSNGLPLLTTDHLTMEQRKNRNAVIAMADDIEAGIQIRGGSTSIPDALNRAHVVLTKDIQTSVIRNGILNSAKKRSKGITLRPSGKKIVTEVKLKPGEHKTEKQIYGNAAKRLQRLIRGKPLK